MSGGGAWPDLADRQRRSLFHFAGPTTAGGRSGPRCGQPCRDLGMPEAFFTEATAAYWQEITSYVPPRFSAVPPFCFGYPARLPDERVLVLPLRQLPAGDSAVASLIANQASHAVIAVLADQMT